MRRCRVQEILGLMHQQWPETRIILMGLLPRGASYADNVEAFRWPNQYTQPFARVNELYQVFPCTSHFSTFVPGVVPFSNYFCLPGVIPYSPTFKLFGGGILCV